MAKEEKLTEKEKEEQIEKQEEKERRLEVLRKTKNLGAVIFWIPIIIAFVIGLLNGFNLNHCWIFRNCGADNFFGFVGLLIAVIGFIIWIYCIVKIEGMTEEEDKEEN